MKIKNVIKLELNLSSTTSLIRGKRYYFQDIDRQIHMIYDLPYSILSGKKSKIEKFNTNRLILRPIVLKNNKTVAVILTINKTTFTNRKIEFSQPLQIFDQKTKNRPY